MSPEQEEKLTKFIDESLFTANRTYDFSYIINKEDSCAYIITPSKKDKETVDKILSKSNDLLIYSWSYDGKSGIYNTSVYLIDYLKELNI